MSQKVIIAIMGAIIVVGGGAWYYQTNMAGSDSATRSSGSARDTAEEKSGGLLGGLKDKAGSFADAITGGGALQCEFSGTDPESGEYMEGMLYVDGESHRVEATTEVDGEKGVFNMIVHNDVLYIWGEDPGGQEVPGMKIDSSMFEDLPEEEKPPSIVDELRKPDSGYESSCGSWIPRKDSFDPPEDVQFIDLFGAMGAMFGGMMQEGMMEMGAEADSYEDMPSDSSDWGY